jgi:hypothetical protein
MRRAWGKDCQECGKKAYGDGRLGSWLVPDAIWKAAGYQPTDVACKRCLVRRLRNKFGLRERSYQDVICAVDAILHG